MTSVTSGVLGKNSITSCWRPRLGWKRVPTVYDLTREQLAERLVAWGEPPFRAKQIWSQLWKRAATYDAMSDVAPALRERLATELPLGVEALDERTADRGATRKALLKLGGAHVIEENPSRTSATSSGRSGS